jgi:hypothetical protein
VPVSGGLESEAQQGAARKGQFSGQLLSATRVALSQSPPQIRLSQTRYTQADFLAQALILRGATSSKDRFLAAPSIGPASTADWLRECMTAIGAVQMQVVEADIAFYEGRPAVIVVGTASGAALAYVVAPQCSHADPVVLRAATPLP